MNYAKDLYRKGEMNKIAEMEQLGNEIIKGKDMGLAFVTEGYEGYDALCVIPNRPAFSNYEGYIVFDEDQQKAVFLKEER